MAMSPEQEVQQRIDEAKEHLEIADTALGDNDFDEVENQLDLAVATLSAALSISEHLTEGS